jgi:hypothetical protein
MHEWERGWNFNSFNGQFFKEREKTTRKCQTVWQITEVNPPVFQSRILFSA